MADQKPQVRGNIVSAFLKEVKDEIGHVTWPSRQQAIRLTAMVVGVSVLVGAYLGLLDYLFTYAMGFII